MASMQSSTKATHFPNTSFDQSAMAHVSIDPKDISHSDTPSITASGNAAEGKIENSQSISETDVKVRLKQCHKLSKSCAESKSQTCQKRRDKAAVYKTNTLQGAAGNVDRQQKPPCSPLRPILNKGSKEGCAAVTGTTVVTENIYAKVESKRKKSRSHNMQGNADIGCFPNKNDKLKISRRESDMSEATLASHGKKNSDLASKNDCSGLDNKMKEHLTKNMAATGKGSLSGNSSGGSATNIIQAASSRIQPYERENTVNCRSASKDGKQAKELQPKLPECSATKEVNGMKISGENCGKKSYSEVVKQRSHKQNKVPKMLKTIRAFVSNDSEGICLRCQVAGVLEDCSVVWTKEGKVLEEQKRSVGEGSEISFTITKASSKDLGWYQCCLTSPQGKAASDFHLTSDVLNELVPSHDQKVDVGNGAAEDVKCSPLMFREDFLSEQFFGKDQTAQILTEEVHFGEGMHRKAFRTKVLNGLTPLFNPGHPCVLKVHNAIEYGTKNNDELTRKNYNLAAEECHVQNTAREYIKAYATVAKSAQSFGEVPEIIPIYLVHRPANDIPYATLEEELLGDFVKYSVKDGKEMNLLRRDSEAGQKSCAFQHWVYHKTAGNLLVTDMQGVGMKLTDVGIATCKKGYKGFRGNCSTSFIDQFKALHQCNTFCELLGLRSLQAGQQKTKQIASGSKQTAKATGRSAFTLPLKSKR